MSNVALQGRKVLIVEDEVLIGIVLEDILDLLGCTVAINAATISDAERVIESETFDVAILDVHVAGESVYPLADRIVARGLPIIFATGASADTLPERFQSCQVLEKPYAFPGVEAALTRALSTEKAV